MGQSRLVIIWIALVLLFGATVFYFLKGINQDTALPVITSEPIQKPAKELEETDVNVTGSTIESQDNAVNTEVVNPAENEVTSADSEKTKETKSTLDDLPDIATTETEVTNSNEAKLLGLDAEQLKLYENRIKLRGMQNDLHALIAKDPKNIDFNELDKILIDLENVSGGTGVIGGVSITQLRQVLHQSNKILMISQNKGIAPGEDKNQKLKEEVEKLKELQKGVAVTNAPQ